MPHSTSASVSSDRTFTLDDNDATNGRRPSDAGSFGVAVTSNPPSAVEDKSRLSFGLHNNKRESTSVEDAYASLVGENRNHVSADLSKPNGEASSKSASATTSAVVPPYDRWSRRRSHSQHFDESPAITTTAKDTFSNSIRDRVLRNSPVIAELKTNVIIKDEFTLVTDLSYHLAQRYSRPESCVMIKVDHSACLALGGGFEPCYILNINTIPSQLGAWSNRRNAALIQTFMAEILSVPAHRGVIKFEAVPEECYAMNGITVQGELEKIERQQQQQRQQQEATLSAGSNPHRKSMSSFNVRRSETKPSRTINGAENTDATSSIWSSEGGPVRPSTSHGFSASSSAASFDGLRMNGVSLEQFVRKNGSPPVSSNNDRPKTLGASPNGSADFTRTEAALAVPARGSSQAQQPQPVLKSSFKSGFSSLSRPGTSKSTKSSSNNNNAISTSQISSPIVISDPIIRPRTTHLEDITALSRKFEQNPNPNNTTTTNKTSSSAAAQSSTLADDYSTAANTAKRRATLSSTTGNTVSLVRDESGGGAPSPFVKPSFLNGSTTGLDRVSNLNNSESTKPDTKSSKSSKYGSGRRSREGYLDQSQSGSSKKSSSIDSGKFPLSPPPIPNEGKGASSAASVKGETRSIRSFRLGQRRSAILNAFRRGMGKEEKV